MYFSGTVKIRTSENIDNCGTLFFIRRIRGTGIKYIKTVNNLSRQEETVF